MTRSTRSTAKGIEAKSDYGVHSIQIHEGLDGIRKRPGMYLGEQGAPMVFQMLKEIIDNAVDEHMADRNDYVEVVVNSDNNEYLVYDHAGGIPVGVHKNGENTLTAVFSKIHAGGKFNDNAYSRSVGTFGTGAAATNAVSEIFEVWTNWKGAWYYQRWVKGKAETDVEQLDRVDEEITDRLRRFSPRRGTLVYFRPDLSVVALNKSDKARPKLNTIADYMKTQSYLNGGLHLVMTSETHNKTIEFKTDKGLVNLIEEKIKKLELEQVTSKILEHTSKDLSFGLSWTNYDKDDEFWSYVNCSRTIDDGKHVDGFFQAYQKALLSVAKTFSREKTENSDTEVKARGRKTAKSRMEVNLDKISIRDLKVGLVGALNIHMSGAAFSSQTKSKLTSDVSKTVEDEVYPILQKFFAANNAVAKSIVNRAKTVASSRESFKNVMKNLSLMKKNNGTFLPDVLACSPDATPDNRELYIVEGLSAFSSATTARDSSFQEVLALSGKIGNANRLPLSKLLKSEPIQNFITSLGADISQVTSEESSLSVEGMRVKRVYIMADSDPDGFHISVLALTLLWRFLPDMFKQGRVWVTNIPLYQAMHKSQFYFADTFEKCYEQMPSGASKNLVVRAKGLAECSVEILEYAGFNPKTRFVIKIDPPDGIDAITYFENLMGDDTAERKKLLGLL